MRGNNFAKGKYQVKNPGKYVGNKAPIFRSSWEWVFMKFCDNNPHVINWASEPIKIKYRNPFTGKPTVYVPDFLVVYVDRTGHQHTELVEVKPSSQTTMESAGRSQHNKMAVALNHAKWEAAYAWARQNGVRFRIITEHDIFMNTRKK